MFIDLLRGLIGLPPRLRVFFRFAFDGDIRICTAWEDETYGLICSVGSHGLHILNEDGTVTGRYAGSWQPYSGFRPDFKLPLLVTSPSVHYHKGNGR